MKRALDATDANEHAAKRQALLLPPPAAGDPRVSGWEDVFFHGPGRDVFLHLILPPLIDSATRGSATALYTVHALRAVNRAHYALVDSLLPAGPAPRRRRNPRVLRFHDALFLIKQNSDAFITWALETGTGLGGGGIPILLGLQPQQQGQLGFYLARSQRVSLLEELTRHVPLVAGTRVLYTNVLYVLLGTTLAMCTSAADAPAWDEAPMMAWLLQWETAMGQRLDSTFFSSVDAQAVCHLRPSISKHKLAMTRPVGRHSDPFTFYTRKTRCKWYNAVDIMSSFRLDARAVPRTSVALDAWYRERFFNLK